jgi:hypothetical protein
VSLRPGESTSVTLTGSGATVTWSAEPLGDAAPLVSLSESSGVLEDGDTAEVLLTLSRTTPGSLDTLTVSFVPGAGTVTITVDRGRH